MIPFGPFRPDSAGINSPVVIEARNCVPSVNGFAPFYNPIPVSLNGLAGRCRGAVTVRLEDGAHHSFAGDATDLYKLGNDLSWSDVSELATVYNTASGERWRFDLFGRNLVATNYIDPPKVYTIGTSALFANLGGSPPNARYIAVVRDFLVLGCLSTNERSIQWSSINNIAEWTPGVNSGDTQEFPSGGPVRGIIGGEYGYIWQAEKLSRMVFMPGTAEVFAFDEVEGARGLAAQNSLVREGNTAYYFGGDGFYKIDLGSGAVSAVGVGKWASWFLNDIRAGTEIEILGGVSPTDKVILWAYISRDNSSSTPDRVLVYSWSLDEATFVDLSVEAMAAWISTGHTLDTINSFGGLDSLPYSLDSPFWKGGQSLLGIFGTDHKLSYLDGASSEALIITSDGQADARSLIKGTRPHVDTSSVTVSVSMRERDGDHVSWGYDEAMEDTGEIPAWASGNIARAKITIAEGAKWSSLKGIKTIRASHGGR